MPERVSSCLWRATPAIVLLLDERFGEPVDSYVNGAQVWLRDDGPGGTALEWRLHPVAGYERPKGSETSDVLSSYVFALANGLEPPAPLDRLWDGLEAFPCYGDEIEPAPLVAACTEALGVGPDGFGVVDHTGVADRWEQANGRLSILDALFAQLDG